MTVYTTKPAINLREELASLRNQGGYSEQQFWFDSLITTTVVDNGGWTVSDFTVTATGTSGSTDNVVFTLSKALTVGATYAFNVPNTMPGGSFYVDTAGGSAQVGALGSSTSVVYLKCTSATTSFRVGRWSGSPTGTIGPISAFEVDANDDVVHTMPKGWVPKDVFEDGLLQREGAANDYEVVYDGFDYIIKPAVAPSATTQTCVIGVRA